jgi:hypothetical protein
MLGEREFCSKMVGAKKIYRIEDIEAMKAFQWIHEFASNLNQK